MPRSTSTLFASQRLSAPVAKEPKIKVENGTYVGAAAQDPGYTSKRFCPSWDYGLLDEENLEDGEA